MGRGAVRLAAAIGVVALVALAAIAATNYPSWWITRGVVNTNAAPADYAPVALGQLKWIASNACDELQTNLPGGAGTGVIALIRGFSLTNNYSPANQGQLKRTATPFYDRLIEEGYTNAYPWTPGTSDDADFAPASQGQVKNAFSFDLSYDIDADGLPGWWEQLYGLNPTSPVPSEGEGWWKFDEGQGTDAANSAGSGYDGHLVNMATSAWVVGKMGGALQFDGNNDYVRVPQSPPILQQAPFTLSGWCYVDADCPSDYPTLLSDMMLCGGVYAGYWLGCDLTVPAAAGLVGDCNGYTYLTAAATIAGRWVHLASTYDGANMRLYIDGAEVAVQSGAFVAATQSEVWIGWANDPGYSYRWKGKLDDVRLYKTVLSSNAISRMYESTEDADGDELTPVQEYAYGTHPFLSDTDEDGVDDALEAQLGWNPADVCAGAGVNSNWVYHGNNSLGSPSWEHVPGLWWRFLMADYSAKTCTTYLLTSRRVGLDPNCTTQIEIRVAWTTNFQSYTESYYAGSWATSVVAYSGQSFHGLPSLGAVTLDVYRIAWPMPSPATGAVVTVYYAPLVKTLTNGTQTGYLWVLNDFPSNETGYGWNNYPFWPQAVGPQYGGWDYRVDLSAVRLRNSGFNEGAPTSHTNIPGWVGYGSAGGVSATIRRGDTGWSFVSRDVDGVYQRIVVHAGEEVVLGGWMYTPSTTNQHDTNGLAGDRFGLLSLEFYDTEGGRPIRIDGARLTPSDAHDTWQYFSVTSLVPASAQFAHVSLRTVAPTMDLSAPGHVYYDDISLEVSCDSDADGMPDRWEAGSARATFPPMRLPTRTATDCSMWKSTERGRTPPRPTRMRMGSATGGNWRRGCPPRLRRTQPAIATAMA